MQYGEVTINGQTYIERAQSFPATVNIATPYQVLVAQRVTLPGVANFLLKGLARDVTVAGASAANRFLFRLGNSDGQTWYMSGGVGAVTDRIIDTNCMGTGQFPFPTIPPITYSAGANIQFEIEDVSGNAPYVISIAFHGSYLIPTVPNSNGGSGS